VAVFLEEVFVPFGSFYISLAGKSPTYHECKMALFLQAVTQGNGSRSEFGLQGLHSYLSFIFFSFSIVTTGSSRSGSFGSSAVTTNTLAGHAGTQSPQPVHFSVSMVMKKEPEAS
jgi:hypothetical protein